MFKDSQLAVFWSKVDKNGPTYIDRFGVDYGPCWLWCGRTVKGGYGRVQWQNKHHFTHRVSWIVANGDVPAGLFVLHRCDVPNCVAPRHLWLGTQAENSADMVAKQRQASGDRNASRLYPERRPRGDSHYWHTHPGELAGERNPSARLTAADVEAIRRRYAAGGITYRQLAAEYGVTFGMIGHIVRGINWRPARETDAGYTALMAYHTECEANLAKKRVPAAMSRT